MVIDAKGKDKRGNGTAGAHVTATMVAEGSSTKVEVLTDLNITGKPAQFGRGVLQDVSDKLLGQFASCLETKLGADTADDADEAATTAAAAPAEDAVEETPIAAEAAAAAKQTTSEPRRTTPPEAPAAELDLGATMLPVLIKRYAGPVIAGIIALWILRKILSRG